MAGLPLISLLIYISITVSIYLDIAISQALFREGVFYCQLISYRRHMHILVKQSLGNGFRDLFIHDF